MDKGLSAVKTEDLLGDPGHRHSLQTGTWPLKKQNKETTSVSSSPLIRLFSAL